MSAGSEDAQHISTRDHGRYRIEPAGECLAKHVHIRLHAFVLTGKQRAGAAQARLNLVGDQQHAALATDTRHLSQITCRRDEHASLALDGLDQESRRIWHDGVRQRRGVAEGNRTEARRERTESLPAFRVGREAHDRRGATVEVVLADQNLRPVWRYALAVVSPLAGGLDGGLDGLRPGVHRQHHLHPAQFRQFATEQGQLIVTICPRGERDPLGLALERSQDARVAVPLVDRRVSTQAIQVAGALYVINPRSLGPCYHHGQRMIVVRAPFVFEREHFRARAGCDGAGHGTSEISAYHCAGLTTPLRARI